MNKNKIAILNLLIPIMLLLHVFFFKENSTANYLIAIAILTIGILIVLEVIKSYNNKKS